MISWHHQKEEYNMEVRITGLERFEKNRKSVEDIVKEFPRYSSLFRDQVVEEKAEDMERYLNRISVEKSNYFESIWLQSILGNESKLSNLSEEFDRTILPTGFNPGEIYTITAVSGGGKTALCSMLTACAITGVNPFKGRSKFKPKRVIYISLEQSREQIIDRIISTISALNNLDNCVPFSEIVAKRISGEHKRALKTACTLFDVFKDRLKVITSSDFLENSIEEIERCVSLICQESEMETMIIVDQFVNIKNANDPIDDTVVKGIKRIATNNSVPVVVLTQLNKNSIANAMDADGNININKISGNALRGTSNLEHQSAFILVMVSQKTAKETERIVKMKCAKNRYGELNEIKMRYRPDVNLFWDFIETRGRKKEEKEVVN